LSALRKAVSQVRCTIRHLKYPSSIVACCDRLVVLNRVAQAVVESVRGQHPEFVFVYRTHPIETMNNNAWQKARVRAGVPQARVHDLKHTYGRRLRAAGVSFEDRQDLLGQVVS
jgi:integrase